MATTKIAPTTAVPTASHAFDGGLETSAGRSQEFLSRARTLKLKVASSTNAPMLQVPTTKPSASVRLLNVTIGRMDTSGLKYCNTRGRCAAIHIAAGRKANAAGHVRNARSRCTAK